MLFRRTVACWRAGLVLGPHDLLKVSACALKGVALADDTAHVRGPCVEQHVRAFVADDISTRSDTSRTKSVRLSSFSLVLSLRLMRYCKSPHKPLEAKTAPIIAITISVFIAYHPAVRLC